MAASDESTESKNWSHTCETPATAWELVSHVLGNYYTWMVRLAVRKAEGWQSAVRESRVSLTGHLFLIARQMKKHGHITVARRIDAILEAVSEPDAFSEAVSKRINSMRDELQEHIAHLVAGGPWFKMIRAGTRYGTVILVTPADAAAYSETAKYYEFSEIKDNRGAAGWKKGEFNEISANEARMTFSPIADGLGFAPDRPDEPFASLEDALAFVREKRAA